LTVLRIDPWDPEYGASIESEEDPDRPPPPVEFDEPVAWAPISVPAVDALPCCAFVDGVRRIDVRLFAESGDVFVPALAGSWGVGVAWSTQPPLVDNVRTGRVVVLGGQLEHPAVDVTIDRHTLSYSFQSCSGRRTIDPLLELQKEMRRQEEALASDVAQEGRADLIVQDGPLNFYANTPTVGLIKRQAQRYLDPARQLILTRLEVGQRTPLFRFEGQQLERYSWYARIGARRVIDGTLAGLVRLEVPAPVGLGQARKLADLTAAVLPRFTAPSWRDSRSPQNLYPVGELERVLRHRLGDPDLVRRGLEAALWTMEVPSSNARVPSSEFQVAR